MPVGTLRNPFNQIGLKTLQASNGQGGALMLPGGVNPAGTGYISSPDSILNSITGDLDVRLKLAAPAYSGFATSMGVIAKRDVDNTDASWRLAINSGATGLLNYTWWQGTTPISATSTSSLTVGAGFLPNVPYWIRWTHDVDNGAGGNDVIFYTSVDGITWVKLGNTVTTPGVTYIDDMISALILGAGSNEGLPAQYMYAEVRNGINGPIVAKFDASQVQVTGQQTPAVINGWELIGSTIKKYEDHLVMPGTGGIYGKFPDHPAARIIGDICLVAKVSADDWSPAATRRVFSKEQVTGNARSYGIGILNTGPIVLRYSVDGTNAVEQFSSVAVPFTDGQTGWIMATRAVATDLLNFYTSLDGTTWTLLGTANRAGGAAGPLASNASYIELGSRAGGGSDNWTGKIYHVAAYPALVDTGAPAWTFDAREIATPWTINGTGWNWQGANVPAKPVMALSLPGASGNYASTPDTAAMSITGDVDIRAKVALDNWSPGVIQSFISKRLSTTGYQLRLNVGGSPEYVFGNGSADGFITPSAGGTAWSPPANGATKWLRVTHDVDNGASGNTRTFYQSDDGVNWTMIGTPNIGAGVATIADGTAQVGVGADASGFGVITGKVHCAEVRNGIDGPIVAQFDASAVAKTGTRLPTTLTRNGTPNLLTPNDASFETSVAGWNGETNCTIAQSASEFLDGTKSMAVTNTAGGSATACLVIGSAIPVVAGKAYTAKLSSRSAITGRTFGPQINWSTAAGVYISSSSTGSATDVTSGWTEASITAVAPPTAALATPGVRYPDVGNLPTEVHYVDRVSLVETADVWTVNGAAWDWVAA